MRKTKTLKKNYEFKNVLDKGKVYNGKQISIYIWKNNKKINVIGIAVGTKQCGVIKRNRIKRLIRENYNYLKDHLEQNYDIVFLWNKKGEADKANFYVIKEDMLTLFKKAQILDI